MYLNIINNIRHESKRKSKKTDNSLEEEKNNLENEVGQIINNDPKFFYSPVFYGKITKNWIKLKL